jgi:hypothetical protein
MPGQRRAARPTLDSAHVREALAGPRRRWRETRRAVFGRRKRQEQEAAREAERRALFAELAKRPETVCPFLGLADSRKDYHDGVTDAHRCYAFGDPAELSAEQQQKVCLQRGYGNCPRYLRGVLVIPTEELEALRRPAPPIEPPPLAPRPRPGLPPPPPAPARESSTAWRLVLVAAVLLIVAAGGGALALYLGRVESSVATTTLPGGTPMRAELLNLSAPDAGGKQALSASAFIGVPESAANTSLIYVLDLSATTRRTGACGGDQNADGAADTTLDCEIASATALNAQAIENGTVGEVGLVGFAGGATTADLAEAAGQQPLIPPDADEDGDGIANVVEVMGSAFTADVGEPVGFRQYTTVTTRTPTTDFSQGIGAACAALSGSEYPNRLVVFLSDGLNLAGANVSTVLPCDPPTVFRTFAAGGESSCTDEPEVGGLATMAQLTDGTCTEVRDLTQLPEILQGAVAAQLTRVVLTIDDGDPVDITNSVAPTLPQPGPVTVEITYSIDALGDGDHDLCLTAHGSDAGGGGEVTSCANAKGGGGPLTALR